MINEIKNRRSIRKFKDKKVSAKIIEKIISAARLAPSGTNKQPWRFIVFTGKNKAEFVNKMKQGIEREKKGTTFLPKSVWAIGDAENTVKAMESAPVIIAVLNAYGDSFGNYIEYENNGEKEYKVNITTDMRVTESVDMLSIGAAVQNILLQAERENIGTLWIANTCFAYNELTEFIDECNVFSEKCMQLVSAVAMGYADERPMARSRKELREIVKYI